MSVQTQPAQENRILASDILTGLVYCIPNIDYIRLPSYFEIGNSDESDYLVSTTLRNLETDEHFEIEKRDLSNYSVPDNQLSSFLMQFGIRGLRTPYKTIPYTKDPNEIPLQGNVTNPKWAFVNLGGSCNSRCVFCYTEWTKSVPDLKIEQIKEAIKNIAELGVSAIVFSGGEVTIRRDLTSILEYAKQMGFTEIEIQTNGRTLKNPKLMQQLVDAGLSSILLSLHGSNENVNDIITRSQGSFLETITGMQNIKYHNLGLTLNIVMCEQNYIHLAEIVKIIEQNYPKNKNIRFSYPIVEGAAFKQPSEILVSFSALRPFLTQAIELAIELNMGTEVANMPLCVFEKCHTTYDVVQQREFIQASPFYKFNELSSKVVFRRN
jgi:sulfatase maturation enzyme AslB (radical SAM superfamily)